MPATHLAAALRHVADAAERERDAINRWLLIRGRPDREILDRRHCTMQRRQLVQAHANLGRRLSRPPPHGCSERFLDSVHRLRQWHAQHTPLAELLEVDDLQFVGTAARIMHEEAGTLEAELPDEALADLNAPLTPGEQAVWDALEGRARNALALAKRLGTKEDTIRHHVIHLRAKGHEIETIGRGRLSRYIRPDAPPP